jgi:L-ribulokinase
VPKLSLGLDFGTNSVRALLVDSASGEELNTKVFDFPSGESGVLLNRRNANLARQNPADWIAGLENVIPEVLRGHSPEDIAGIGVDTTGSSPLPLDQAAMPLALNSAFSGDLDAQCWLWKDHTAHAEAQEITDLARRRGEPYLAKCGGVYSSEWFWSKILHCARTAPEVFDRATIWSECCDWVVSYLTGNRDPLAIRRSVCAAGHKAMFSTQWGGWPSADFLSELDPRLAQLRSRLGDEVHASDQTAGTLDPQLALRLGLRPGIPVAVGALDAHFGAVGSGVRQGVLVKILGTSTCDCMVHPMSAPLPDIPGLCGIVEGSILPGHYGLEAGQSAVGDIFNWFSRFSGMSQEDLSKDASELRPGQSGLLALDWNHGNRTVLVDPRLTGLLVGQTLHTTPAEVYRALIEATAFGALKIIRRIEAYGVRVEEIVNCGGIAEKSPLVMQIYADVCNRPMMLARSGQACALGAAIFGAVAGGVHPSAEAAQAAMAGVKELIYRPDPNAARVYSQLYGLYEDLHDAFGTAEWTGNLAHVMKELIRIRGTA